MSWERVRNNPYQALEFAAVHDNFAWRRHHASRFGVLRGKAQKYASDSLSRAFESELDSIPKLFKGVNRISHEHPEYGRARFAVVWYEGEEWALLCTPNVAAIIESSLVSEFKREKKNADQMVQYLQLSYTVI